jgi:hypothetical protein
VVDLVGCHSFNIFPLAGDQARHSTKHSGSYCSKARDSAFGKRERVSWASSGQPRGKVDAHEGNADLL